MASERDLTITDQVFAEMVDCLPPAAPAKAALPEAPDCSPATRAREACIEQTGADPPPEVSCG